MKKRISTQSAKSKGRLLQQWVCRRISKITGYEFGKDCPIESRPMGQSGTDVRMESQVIKSFPFSVECKSQESWSVHQWILQAQLNCIPDTDWLLVCKSNRNKPIVIIDADVFFSLVEKLNKSIIKQRRKRRK